jgi:hypothetical protein
MKTTEIKKATHSTPVEKLVIERFINVVMRDSNDAKAPYALQAVGPMGKLLTLRAKPSIWKRVLGTIDESGNKKHLGLRNLADVKFVLHLTPPADNTTKLKTIVGVDIVPRRMHISGATPVSWGAAKTKGFNVTWDDELQGFDTLNEEEERREAYAGMTERQLYDVMDGIRDEKSWGSASTKTIAHHKVTKDGVVYNVRPLKGAKPERR